MLHIASGAITFWPRSNSTLLQVFQTALYPPAPSQLSLAALSQLTEQNRAVTTRDTFSGGERQMRNPSLLEQGCWAPTFLLPCQAISRLPPHTSPAVTLRQAAKPTSVNVLCYYTITPKSPTQNITEALSMHQAPVVKALQHTSAPLAPLYPLKRDPVPMRPEKQ